MSAYVPKHALQSSELVRVRRDNFYIWLCYFSALMLGFEFGGYQYIFLNVRLEFGFSNTMMATVNAIQTAVSLAAALVLSMLVDRVDKKKLLCFGAGIYTLGTALMLAAGNAFLFFSTKILSGLGSGMIQAAVFPAMTLICPEKSAKYTGMQQVFMSSGSVLAPLLLSYLLGSQLNLHWRVHYIIILVMSCLVFLGLLCSRPSVTRYVAVEQEGAVAVPARKVLFTLPFLLVLFASALYMNMETGFMNYAREFYEVSGVGGQAGIAISLIWGSMVVSRFITSRLGRGRGVLLVCSFSLAGVALALMILLPIPGLVLVWAVLFGLAAGPGWPTILGIGLEAFPERAGLLSSVNMMFTNVGSMLGAYAVGAASDLLGMQTAIWAAVAFAVVGAVVGGAAHGTARRKQEAEQAALTAEPVAEI